MTWSGPRAGASIAGLVVVLALAAAACGGGGATAAPTTTSTTVKAGLSQSTPSGVPLLRHVFVVVLENHSYEEVMGPSGQAQAPYFHSLLAQGVSLDQMYGVDHDSLTNYIAMTSGYAANKATRADCIAAFCPYPPGQDENLADQLDAVNLGWRAYMEGMPEPCTHSQPGKPEKYLAPYAARHNPFLYYSDVILNAARCQASDVPLSDLAIDMQKNDAPAFGLIVPNTCNDAHDGGSNCNLAAADRWLSKHMPAILESNTYASGSLVIITFDESENSDTRGCCGNAQGGRIATVLLSPAIAHPGTTSSVAYSHFSILRTVEDAFNLKCLRHACDPGTKPFGNDVWDAKGGT